MNAASLFFPIEFKNAIKTFKTVKKKVTEGHRNVNVMTRIKKKRDI